MLIKKSVVAIASIAALTATLTGCSQPEGKTVTIATHDSFVITDELKAAFEKQTGLTLTVVNLGDAGQLVNKLVLTKDDPVADAYFGIDNTFLSRATDAGVTSSTEAVDFGDVCLNYDTYYFDKHELAPLTDFTDLLKPDYAGLTVLENPATSSTGLAFLAATVAEYGLTDYKYYWQQLKDSGVKLDASWSDAYYTDFTGTNNGGQYPIVLSYSTSPADEVREDGLPQTASVSEKCFRQTEYAGVLANAKNPNNAKLLVDFLLSDAFQNSIAENMYMYPSKLYPKGIPASWSQFGLAAKSTIGEAVNFKAGREDWIQTVNGIFGQ